MTNTFYADPAIGGSGRTYTDGTDPITGLQGSDGYGYVDLLVLMFADCAAISAFAKAQTELAAAAALTAVNAPGTSSTSTTSQSLADTGDVTFTTQASKNYVPGQYVRAARTSAPSASWMSGYVKSYSGTTLVITMDAKSAAAGPFTDWTLSLAAVSLGAVPVSRQISAAGLATGGGTFSADRTITVTAAAASDVRTGTDTSKAVTPGALAGSAAFITLTDAATVAWNAASGFNGRVTLAGNRTIGNPTNLIDGMTYTLALVQDATGSRTVTWSSAWDWGEAGAPSLSTGANKVDLVYAQYMASTGKLYASFRKAA